MEEALGNGVVMAIAPPTHAGNQIVFAKERLPLPAGKLGTLVGVNHDLLLWFAPPNGRQSSL